MTRVGKLPRRSLSGRRSGAGSSSVGVVAAQADQLAPLMLIVQSGRPSERQKAFAQIYDQLADMVYSHALAVLRIPEAAEDTMQEAMLAVWDRCAKWDPSRGSVTTWVMLIARSRTLDKLRQVAREARDNQSRLTAAENDSLSGVHIDPDSVLTLDVREMLTKLPEREQRIIYMAYFAHMTHHEIAGELDIAEGTVKSTLYAALRRMRNEMDGNDDA